MCSKFRGANKKPSSKIQERDDTSAYEVRISMGEGWREGEREGKHTRARR
jgi:hypothetical protein